MIEDDDEIDEIELERKLEEFLDRLVREQGRTPLSEIECEQYENIITCYQDVSFMSKDDPVLSQWRVYSVKVAPFGFVYIQYNRVDYFVRIAVSVET